MKAFEASEEYDKKSDKPPLASNIMDRTLDDLPSDPEPATAPEPEKTAPVVTEPTTPAPQPEEPTATPVPVTVEEPAKEPTTPESKPKPASPTPEPPKATTIPGYTPSYKTPPPAPEPAKKINKPQGRGVKVIDVTPKKQGDPTKEAMYARERAALSALASQRRLNGTVALYVTQHLNFKTRVFIDRVEYSGSFGKNIIPIEQIAWVKLRHGGTGVILETSNSKKVVLVVKPTDRLEFADAVLKTQAMQPKRLKFKDTQTVRLDQLEKFSEGVDELEKLAKLLEKGILTQDEFDNKKKQILGL